MTPADVAAAQTLLQQRVQLQSRLSQVNQTQSLGDIIRLLEGTAVQPEHVLSQSQAQVAAFFQAMITSIEAQLTALGVTLS